MQIFLNLLFDEINLSICDLSGEEKFVAGMQNAWVTKYF